jgi:hypothetical protein
MHTANTGSTENSDPWFCGGATVALVWQLFQFPQRVQLNRPQTCPQANSLPFPCSRLDGGPPYKMLFTEDHSFVDSY